MVNLGYLALFGRGVPKDRPTAIAWFERAAAAGNSQAMKNLGVAYENGTGVVASDATALTWYRRAVAAGNTDAQHPLDDLQKRMTAGK